MPRPSYKEDLEDMLFVFYPCLGTVWYGLILGVDGCL